jgi:photosystem II oxygen-evolving enhancer protein 3
LREREGGSPPSSLRPSHSLSNKEIPAIADAHIVALGRRTVDWHLPILITHAPKTFTLKTKKSHSKVLSGFAAGAAALLGAGAAKAVTPVDLFDDRKARATGFDLIYEARDLSLTQAQRDGLVEARSSVEETKKRVKASEARIDSGLEPFVSKAYWTEAREELRRQVGTLRFDLNTLASAKGGKAEKKQGLALSKGFIAAVEDLDLSLRKKDKTAALAKLGTAKAKLDEVLAYLL